MAFLILLVLFSVFLNFCSKERQVTVIKCQNWGDLPVPFAFDISNLSCNGYWIEIGERDESSNNSFVSLPPTLCIGRLDFGSFHQECWLENRTERSSDSLIACLMKLIK
ncbi:hypothetical protein B6U96_09125 [Archaeoglobales archaeon ex4484_92]|nr:MAG: hypothetical protein B6U96_09125 [Archaeoglobales archaeon ex4484_92]